MSHPLELEELLLELPLSVEPELEVEDEELPLSVEPELPELDEPPELEELPESEKRLRQALALEPENTKVISNLGIVSLKAGKPEEALGFFRTVLEIDPADPVAARYIKNISENS